MKKKVLLVSPTHNNGGIASWTKKYIKDLPQVEYELFLIASDPKRKPGKISAFQRVWSGITALCRVMGEARCVLAKEKVDILHKTTSGSIGALTDWMIGRYCRKHGAKNILHCHYGCIPEILNGKGFLSWLALKSMRQFDQIWVLDKRTYNYLKQRNDVNAEIILTPNCINVKPNIEIIPKSYANIAFIGNLCETKGVLELIDAIKKIPEEIQLHIVGEGDGLVKQHIMEHAGDLYGNRVKCYGRLPNAEAVEFMKRVDILALPTYYPFEAFPISILEAMSLGKLVISTSRAAIGDMLTTDEGHNCGLFVREKNVDDIATAINWAYHHKHEADNLCQLAYQKVYQSYRTEIIYQLYLDCYRKVVIG